MQRLVAIAILGAAGCRLGPLVDDQPGASANVLPKDAVVPAVATNADLTKQITLNDGLDSNALMASNNVIVRGTGGFTAGMKVNYWAFGEADVAPTPIYVFGRGDPTSTSFTPLTDHPPMVEVVPGDTDYEPMHTIYRVAVTSKYAGEKITTLSALSDALDLQLIEQPVAIQVFVNWPIVRPGLKLEVGGTTGSIGPTPVYAHGYVADSFPLGGARGMQPNPRGILPTSQVTFMRGANQANYDMTRPIFQASIPMAPAQMDPNYTPVSVVVNVDLAGTMMPSQIDSDDQLFMRSATGDIMTTTGNVARFTITDELTDLQIQFMDGSP